MVCVGCEGRDIAEAAARHQCSVCFQRVIQKRVRREARRLNAVAVKDDGSIEAAVARDILAALRRGRGTTVEATTADAEAEDVLAALLLGTKRGNQQERLMTTVTRDECRLYARLRGLQGREKRNKYKDVCQLLEHIKKAFPDAPLAIAKGGGF